MKKRILIVAMLCLTIVCSALLAGCGADKITIGFMNGVDDTAEYVEINFAKYEGKKLVDVLKGEKSLGAVIEKGEFGSQLLEIKGLKQEPENNKWFSVYTSLETDKMLGDETITIEKGGVTYYLGNGIDFLSVGKDIKILIVLIDWSKG